MSRAARRLRSTLHAAAALGAAAGALAAAPAAHGQTEALPPSAKTWTSGAVVVTFRGDPATCAAAGTCGLDGTTRWSPAGTGELTVFPEDGRQHFSLSSALAGSGETSTVVRRAVPGGSRVCSDHAATNVATGLEGEPTSDAAIRTVRLFTDDAAVFGSACPGPVTPDLSPLAPTAQLDVARLRRGSQRLDLRGERTFTAGGLTGTLRSTVVVDVGRLRAANDGVLGGITTGGMPDNTLAVRYRVARAEGRMTIDATGPADPVACLALDACGARFSTVLTPRITEDSEVEVAALAVGEPRTPRSALLTALGRRAGTPGGDTLLGLTGVLQRAGSATTTVLREAAPPCHGGEAPVSFVLLGYPASAGRTDVRLGLVPQPLGRCGGPTAPQGLDELPVTAFTAPLTTAMLRRDEVVLRFDGTRRLRLAGFPSVVRSDVRLVLRRAGAPRRP